MKSRKEIEKCLKRYAEDLRNQTVQELYTEIDEDGFTHGFWITYDSGKGCIPGQSNAFAVEHASDVWIVKVRASMHRCCLMQHLTISLPFQNVPTCKRLNKAPTGYGGWAKRNNPGVSNAPCACVPACVSNFVDVCLPQTFAFVGLPPCSLARAKQPFLCSDYFPRTSTSWTVKATKSDRCSSVAFVFCSLL